MTQCSVVYDNYDDFQLNFIFSQNFTSLFWGLFNDETDPMKEMFKSTWHNVVYSMMKIMMIFNSTSYFHKISFHYFEDYLMMKLSLG
jgi:hypothetical protein